MAEDSTPISRRLGWIMSGNHDDVIRRAALDASNEIASLRQEADAHVVETTRLREELSQAKTMAAISDQSTDGVMELMNSVADDNFFKDARIAELTEALRPFAEAKECLDPSYLQDCDHVAIFDTGADQAIKVGDVIKAFDVLCQATKEQEASPGSASEGMFKDCTFVFDTSPVWCVTATNPRYDNTTHESSTEAHTAPKETDT